MISYYLFVIRTGYKVFNPLRQMKFLTLLKSLDIKDILTTLKRIYHPQIKKGMRGEAPRPF